MEQAKTSNISQAFIVGEARPLRVRVVDSESLYEMPTGDSADRPIYVAAADLDIRNLSYTQDSVTVNGLATPATIVNEYSVTLTNVDTEYSQALPAGTKKVFYHSTAGQAFRASYVTGKVATPTQPYEAVAAGSVCYDDGLLLAASTLYFATDVAGDIIFLRCFS